MRDGATGEVLGLWLSDPHPAQDDDFVLALLAKHDLLDAARQGIRRVPNHADNNGGLFVMFGGNAAPGEPAAAAGQSRARGAGSGKTLTINGGSYPVREDFESFSRDAAAGNIALLRTTIDAPVRESTKRLSDALADVFGKDAPQTRASTEMTLHCLHCSMGYPTKYVQLRDDFRDGTVTDFIEPGATPDARQHFEKILKIMHMTACIDCGGRNAVLLYDPSRRPEHDSEAEGDNSRVVPEEKAVPDQELAEAGREPFTHVVDGGQGGDYSTIGDAVRAAAPGDRILVRAGVYEESVVLEKPLELIGDGSSGDVIVESSGAPAVVFQADTGRVANLTLREVGDDSNIRTVRIVQGRLALEDCDITSAAGCCVVIAGGADPHLRHNRIHDGGEAGVYVINNGLGTLEDNDIYNNSKMGVGIRGGNPTLRGNRIHDNKTSGVYSYNQALGLLEDNDITSNTNGGIAISGGANPTVRGNRIRDNIGAGVFAADEGLGLVEDNDISGNSMSGVSIKTDGNPTVRGNRIHDNEGSGVYAYDRGLGLLEDNDITGNASPGVTIGTGGNPTVRGNRIRDGKRSGVFVHQRGAGVLENNDISGNSMAGVTIKTGGNPTVRGDRIRDNKQSGIWVADEGLGVIEDNDITGNTYDGVAVTTSGNPTVRGNTISRNAWSAIHIYDKGAGKISGNRLHGNTKGSWNIAPECEPNVVRQDNDADPPAREPEARTGNVVTIPSESGYVPGEKVGLTTPEVESLIDELVDIGNGRGFMTVEKDDERTREIGHRLHAIGGKRLMQQVHGAVSGQVRRPARELDVAWNRIGDWRG